MRTGSLIILASMLAIGVGLARPVAGPIWPGGPGDGAAPPAPDFDPATAARSLDSAGYTNAPAMLIPPVPGLIDVGLKWQAAIITGTGIEMTNTESVTVQ